MAPELASCNTTVNCVAPGFVDTDMTRGLSDDQRKKLLEQVPLRRLGTPEDVAQVKESFTGQYLKPYLNKRRGRAKPGQGNNKRRGAASAATGTKNERRGRAKPGQGPKEKKRKESISAKPVKSRRARKTKARAVQKPRKRRTA